MINATVTPGLLDQHHHEQQHQHQHHHEQQHQHQHHHEHEDNCLCDSHRDSNTNGITIVNLTIAYVIVIAFFVLITLMV